MNDDLGLLVLRLAVGGVVLAHGFIKIGWPISMGMRGMAAVAGGGKVGVEFPIPLTAGALSIALIGLGGWSLDAALSLTYPDWLLPAWLVLTLAGDTVLLVIRAVRRVPAQQSAG